MNTNVQEVLMSPNWAMEVMKRHGLSVTTAKGPVGMIRLTGRRQSEKSV